MKLCVALDMSTKEQNLALVKKLKGCDIWLKVGLRSYIRDGAEFINAIKEIDSEFKIFLDLKLYDIPNTMADAAESIMSLGVDMFNIHASAGKRAMSEVMQRVAKYEKRPIVLAVTALTSFDEDEFQAVYNTPLAIKAEQFAQDAFESGLNGVVCSAHESLQIKNATNERFLTLTPGIRPFGETSNDQKRVAGINDAANAAVDFIVVGRPIYDAQDPLAVTRKILDSLGTI